MRALEQNVDAQINGIVGIAYECIKDEQYMMHFDLELLRASAKLYTALPIKYQAFHFCYDDVKMNTVVSFFVCSSSSKARKNSSRILFVFMFL